MQHVTALCERREIASAVLEKLIESNFSGDDISIVLAAGEGEIEPVPIGQRTAIPVTLPVGAVAGGAAGVVVALTGGLPALGLLAAGPVIAAIEGLALGTAAGSFLGTLAGLGWWKTDAEIPEPALRAGAVLVGISVPEARVDAAATAMRQAGAAAVSVR